LTIDGCDYLIVTASNEYQADIYRKQLDIRRRLGLLAGIDKILVVPDVDGKRIGSGGSTLCCLLAVLREELGAKPFPKDTGDGKQAFANKRVLIIHAGGDSKRLPVYGACGKLFVPIPGQWDCPLPLTLFDRQLHFYLGLFGKDTHAGQFIMTSGDVLLRFKTDPLECSPGAVTGFCCPTSPEQASRHGVFCLEQDNKVRLYLQKPSYEQQKHHRALNNYNQAMLDIGIMAFDGDVAAQMLTVFGLRYDSAGKVVFEGKLAKAIIEKGLDFYRELCCVFGSQATKQLHRESAWGSDSTWSEEMLSELFDRASTIGLQAKPLAHCEFLDFGNIKQIISSGYRLAQDEGLAGGYSGGLSVNNIVAGRGAVSGSMAWVEGCVIEESLHLEGNNIVTGADVKEYLSLGQGQCLDVVPGQDERGNSGWFVRCYGFGDDFKSAQKNDPQYCGVSIQEWSKAAGIGDVDIWDKTIKKDQRSLFNAKLFPFVQEQRQFRDFLWMYDPAKADPDQIARWKTAARFSHKEIALLTDTELFHQRRQSHRLCELHDRVSYLFRPQSQLSAQEIGYILGHDGNHLTFIRNAIAAAYSCAKPDALRREDIFVSSRILHSLGTAWDRADWPRNSAVKALSELKKTLLPEWLDWLKAAGVCLSGTVTIEDIAAALKNAAFRLNSSAIVQTTGSAESKPRSCLRADEIVWARAPARLDIAGGWTDTPPYALEWGGAVLNAAVNLNGQPPIQAYLRVVKEPVIKIGSIDLGLQVVIRTVDELKNYADVSSGFSLAKAAFLQELFAGSESKSLEKMLLAFGGGIELTTLAAIPKGSGLGTSSIMGAVIVAAINRARGRNLSNRELFNAVLKLEQRLTTGGGWQDQIGGVLEGVKFITSEPGLVPDPSAKYLRRDLIDPRLNDGRTLLYYTGITRLAKNILQEVVGRYLNREHHAMQGLKQIYQAALDGAEIIGAMDYAGFGRLLGRSWRLNKSLDPNSSNPQVESLFERIGPYVHGAKLLGAGGGGFVLMACKSGEDAEKLHKELTEHPSDANARFFGYDISSEGLVVTVC